MTMRDHKAKRLVIIFHLILIFLLIIAPNSEGKAEKRLGWEKEIQKRVKKGGIYAIDEEGRPLFSMNPHQLLIPASTLKVVTALCGFHYLGKDYRFQTIFGLDQEGNLYIKGFGDPYLISEEIEQIAKILKENGLNWVRSIRVDGSAFNAKEKIPGVAKGAEPYNFPTGALSANFNTILVEFDKKGNVISVDPHTPITPFTLRIIREKKVMGKGTIRILVGPSPNYPGLYAGSLFKAFFEKEGIKVTGDIEEGSYPQGIQPIYIHNSSMTLEEVVEEMLLHSNNFIANQIFLAIGGKVYGYPATFDKGVRAMEAYIRGQCNIGEFKAVEGSGISRENLISAESLVKVMTLFKSYKDLLVKKHGIMGKTGTLKGVWSVAGFFPSSRNGIVTFAIILNQPRNFRWEILKFLKKGLQ
jgi:D-alanyl-D-alanine carboxypeptidase/D-alanyl-D-alanine-endopeptidase (penicillin-binding protein 4)